MKVPYPIIDAFLVHKIKTTILHRELIQEIIHRYRVKREKTKKIARTWSSYFKWY